MLELASEGLQTMGLGEECYLDPLFTRAETLSSPARTMKEALEAGTPLQDLIERYSLQQV